MDSADVRPSTAVGKRVPARYTAAMARRRRPLPPRGPQLELAGAPCVAFVNTAGARPENRQQGVSNLAEFLVWCQKVGTLSSAAAERLGRRAAERPREAEAAFAKVAGLRAELVRLFAATWREEPLTQENLAAVNEALAPFLPDLRLVPAEKGVAWDWTGNADALDRALWPILQSATEVLIAAEGRPQVRRCAAEGCNLFFLDRSPSGHRVWCEMKTCGNRMKNLRYARRRGKGLRRR